MLNLNRESLIRAIETVTTDDVATIEWNLELIYIDLCANRGTNNEGLVSAYKLIASTALDSLKKVTK
jgi:hypothetical protein